MNLIKLIKKWKKAISSEVIDIDITAMDTIYPYIVVNNAKLVIYRSTARSIYEMFPNNTVFKISATPFKRANSPILLKVILNNSMSDVTYSYKDHYPFFCRDTLIVLFGKVPDVIYIKVIK